MSENGEIYTAGKNFTLPPAVTALTNSTSDGRMVGKHRKLSHTVNEPQKHPKNIAPDGLAKNRIIDDGKLKTMKIP